MKINNKSGLFGEQLKTIKIVLSWSLGFICTLILFSYSFACFGDSKCTSDWPHSNERFMQSTYLAVQLLFANADSAQTSKLPLQILRILAPFFLPLLAVFAFVKPLNLKIKLTTKYYFYLIGYYLPFIQLIFKDLFHKDLVIIIGLGYKGVERALVELEINNSYVIVIEKNPNHPEIIDIETNGGMVWIGDGLNKSDLRQIFWKRPTKVWILNEDTQNNLLILNNVKDYLKEPTLSSKRKNKLVNIYSGVNEFIERREIGTLEKLNNDTALVWTNLFNHEEHVASWLFKINQIRQNSPQDPVPRLLVIGLGPLGRAIIRELMLLCHFPSSSDSLHKLLSIKDNSEYIAYLKIPEIIGIDKSISSIDKLKTELPLLRSPKPGVTPFISFNIKNINMEEVGFSEYIEHIRSHTAFTHVIISTGNEAINIALAQRIAAWEIIFNNKNIKNNLRIIPLVYNKNSLKENVNKEYEEIIFPFSVNDAYSPDAVKWNERIIKIAQIINYFYAFKKDFENKDLKLDIKNLEREWRKLNEQLRLSNLAKARYTYNRWWNSEIKCWDETIETVKENECEHRRWNAFKIIENNQYIDQIIYPEAHGINRNMAQVHKDLKHFDKLDDNEKKEKEKDSLQFHSHIKKIVFD